MKSAQLRARYRQIIGFSARVAANVILWDIFLSRLGLRSFARKTRQVRLKKFAVQFRAMAIRMGGVMIKVGQFLSSRLDVLPPEIVEELSGLQDEVPAEDFDAIRELAEAELDGSLEEIFESFDPEPMAAASLGQVHRARLLSDSPDAKSYREIVVKIQRPHIKEIIEVDLSALRRVGGWLERYKPIRQRADVKGLIEEFSTTIYEEVDYLAEGKNVEIFQEHFAIMRVSTSRA